MNSQSRRRLSALSLAGLGLGLALLSGCQTWTSGMTLPSGHYLEHLPQYFPPTPAYPLSRELATQQIIAGSPVPGGEPLPAPLPAPLPPPLPPAGP